jgi:hypothetical protein
MLVTPAELADVLSGVSPSDTQVIAKAKASDAFLKRGLNRQFERAIYVLYPRSNGRKTIFLRESPIRALIEVRVDPFGLFPDSSIVDLSMFAFNPDPFEDDPSITFTGLGWCQDNAAFDGAGYYRWYMPFPDIPHSVQVTVEAGWWPADDVEHDCDLPYDIRDAALERAVVRFKESGDFGEEVQTVRSGDQSWTKFQQTDERLLKKLTRYKR